MGTTVAIVGENMRTIKEVWFNDQQAVLNTSLITPTALIVQVPETLSRKRCQEKSIWLQLLMIPLSMILV